MTSLPSDWSVRIGEDPPFEGTVVDLRVPKERSFSVAVFERGAAAVGLKLPRSGVTVVLGSSPTFDDMWTLYMLVRAQEDAALRNARPASWGAIAEYAEESRHGASEARVNPERAMQSMIEGVAAKTLPKTPDRFVTASLRLCERVAERVEGRAKILADDLIIDDPSLKPHLASLREDRRLYRKDVKRGRRFAVTFPTSSRIRPTRTLPLLVLDQPASRLFKIWVRRDDAAPHSSGWPITLVRYKTGKIVLSIDPALEMRIDWLAKHLSAAETGDCEAWYDGCHHDGMLVSSPKASKLGLIGVLGVLKQQAKLERARNPLSDGMLLWSLLMTAFVCAAGFLLEQRLHPDVAPMEMEPSSEPIAASSVAPPMGPEEKTRSLLDPKTGITSLTPYALVIGVCSYGSPGSPLPEELAIPRLPSSCNNAWELAHLLVQDYHYAPDHVVLMLDDSSKVERKKLPGMPVVGPTPTRANVQRVLDTWQSDHPGHDPESASFLFYYSGHSTAPEQNDAYLQLANWESDIRKGRPRAEAGLAIAKLIQAVPRQIPSKHVLFLFDTARTVWLRRTGETETSEITHQWADSVTYGIAASERGETAREAGTEEGTTFSSRLLEGLQLKDGIAKADLPDECGSPDHVVTHGELERYLTEDMPDATLETSDGPRAIGQRLDPTTGGQFLFVSPDASKYLASRSCDRRAK